MFWDLLMVRIYFIDEPSTGQTALILGIQRNTDTDIKYFSYVGTSSIENDEYVSIMDAGNGNRLVFITDDVVDGELDAVIQVKVHMINSQGQETSLGQFSTLVGYGPN
jgi:hypothetical protein